MADEHIVPSEASQTAATTDMTVKPVAESAPAADGVPKSPPPLAIPLADEPTVKTAASQAAKTDAKPAEPKDVYREIFETVVFVVVLVLLLKTFVAEAFVIPTGSMATTLWGYQKQVTCPNCGYAFPVNCSSEVDPQTDRPRAVLRCECPNCRYEIDFLREGIYPPWHSGDRVLVFKALYDSGLRSPQRHDVVVFKFPVEPQTNHTAMNYIKRLIGLPGETIAIAQGQLYVCNQAREVSAPDSYWSNFKNDQYSWPDDKEGKKLWDDGKFTMIRKSPEMIVALRRIVFDNDFQPTDTQTYPTRWSGSGWKGDSTVPRRFDHTAAEGESAQWLRYQHILPVRDNQPNRGGKPELIDDFMGYNSNEMTFSGANWVGDLILEADVQFDKAQGELSFELSRGVDRFQARFNLATGECVLVRLTLQGDQAYAKPAGQRPPDQETELARKPTSLKAAGTYRVRFANVDERLTVWVGSELPFGNGVDYPSANPPGPTINDLEPASIGAKGATVQVSRLQLWRDTYYTGRVAFGGDVSLAADGWGDPTRWEEFRKLSPQIMYVHPGHYLCLGDNSPASSDSRSWGMVPERLMLGRALVVYFPFYAPFPPLNTPSNRAGLIR